MRQISFSWVYSLLESHHHHPTNDAVVIEHSITISPFFSERHLTTRGSTSDSQLNAWDKDEDEESIPIAFHDGSHNESIKVDDNGEKGESTRSMDVNDSVVDEEDGQPRSTCKDNNGAPPAATEVEEEEFKFTEVSDPLSISFRGLNLVLKSSRKKIITDVSVIIEHHKLTALMGPSGAGAATPII
jgi:hypothetical protein